jgi:Ca2+-binding RTX toxin-like protein
MATISDVMSLPVAGVTTIDALLDEGPSWNYQTPEANLLYFTFSDAVANTGGITSLSLFNANQIAATRQALTYIESVTGIDFVETTNTALADFHFASANILSSGVSGFTAWEHSYFYTSGNFITSYDALAYIYLDIYDYTQNTTPLAGTSGYQVLLHEIGHALGLKHPFEGNPTLSTALDDTNHTLMSYTWVGGNKTTFQEYDVDALWWIYGGDGLGGTYGVNSSNGSTLPSDTPPTDITPPAVEALNPADEATDVAINSNMVFTFSEDIQRGTGNIVLKTTVGVTIATYNAASSANLSISGNTLTINPTSDLFYSTGYKVEVAAGTIKDLAGNSYAGTTIYNFTTVANPISPTGGNDTLIGSSLADTINALGGNDVITGGGGNDILNGGAGIDTAIFSATSDAYQITAVSDNKYTVSDQRVFIALIGADQGDGTDTLTNIERLQFSNSKVALDLTPTGHAGQALEFIGTLAHNLISTPSVVGTILNFFDQAYTMTSLSQFAIDVGLINQLAGSSSNADLARLVFRNVIGQEADTGSIDMLVSYMDGRNASFSQAEFIATVAELEVNQQHINLVGLAQTGIEYVSG